MSTIKSDNRRKLLKSTAAGALVAPVVSQLPNGWVKPVVDAALLPAHAQGTTRGASVLRDEDQVPGGVTGLSLRVDGTSDTVTLSWDAAPDVSEITFTIRRAEVPLADVMVAESNSIIDTIGDALITPAYAQNVPAVGTRVNPPASARFVAVTDTTMRASTFRHGDSGADGGMDDPCGGKTQTELTANGGTAILYQVQATVGFPVTVVGAVFTTA